MLNDNALSTDWNLSDDKDSYDEENEHTTEQLSTVAVQVEQQEHISEPIICIDTPYGMFRSYIIYMPILQ